MRLREDGLAKGGHELMQHAPGAGTGQAASSQRGESSNSSTSGSSSKIIRRCTSRYGLAERSSTPGGPLSPTRLLRRLKASSIRHLRRYKANTSSVVKAFGDSEVTRMTHSAAASVPCEILCRPFAASRRALRRAASVACGDFLSATRRKARGAPDLRAMWIG